jgi:hypothetical protein
VGGRHYVSVVLRYFFICECPLHARHVVDRRCDRLVESYVVHPSWVGLVEPGLEGGEDYVSDPP